MKTKPLPFTYHALEPFFSRSMVEEHYSKHFLAYVKNLNILISKTIFENADIPTLVKVAKGPILYNAIQIQNHEYYFDALIPGVNKPEDCDFISTINGCFGSLQFFKDTFIKYAISIQSGWIWLVINKDGIMEIVKNQNTGRLLHQKLRPLLVCDLWEHAYQKDFGSDKKAYTEAFLNLVNWQIITDRYHKAVEKESFKNPIFVF
jgi:superoxide dismutase, Fe-Mn family